MVQNSTEGPKHRLVLLLSPSLQAYPRSKNSTYKNARIIQFSRVTTMTCNSSKSPYFPRISGSPNPLKKPDVVLRELSY